MTAPPRLIALDVLRGVAVMGILLMNIAGFALPQAAYLNPAAFGGATGIDLAVWAVNFVLVDGKMRALFSLLFGAGMVLVIDRAEAAGQDGTAVHLRRMAALLVIGLVHAFCIWSGDILIPYAIVGTIALTQIRRDTRTLVAVAAVLLVAQWLLLWSLVGSLDAARAAAAAPSASPATIDAWRRVADQIGIPSLVAIARELATYRGNYLGILHERLAHPGGPLLQLIDVGAETLALMLLGAAGLRSGFLTGSWSSRTYRRVAVVAYTIGVPILMLVAARTVRSGFDEIVTIRGALLHAAPLRILMMLGHIALLLLWVKRAPDHWLTLRLTAVGRTALSNYLATSLAMTSLFYGYGLGWFGMLGRAQLYLLVPPVWLAMCAWSKPWLDRFRFGPAEWLWRSLARGAWQPIAVAHSCIEKQSQ